MKTAGVSLAIVLALALQTTLVYASGFSEAINLVLVVVMGTALLFGPVAGMFTGSIAGLAQDSLSGGVVGVGGLASTLAGFVAGWMAAQFIVTSFVSRLFVMFIGSLVYGLCVLGLNFMIDLRPVDVPYATAFTQASVNAVLGAVCFRMIETLPETMHRRRLRRGMRR